MVCPNCGCQVTSARKVKAVASALITDTAQMSTPELYAHYKRIAHVEDVRFFCQVTSLSEDIRSRAAILLDDATRGLSRADTLKRLTLLQDDWRTQDRPIAPDSRRYWVLVKLEKRRVRQREARIAAKMKSGYDRNAAEYEDRQNRLNIWNAGGSTVAA